MKFYQYFIYSLIAILFVSCTNSNPTEESGSPKVNFISPTKIFTRGVFNIYGENFGERSPNNKILLSDTISISSMDTINCVKWNASVISIVIPQNSKSCLFRIVLGADTIVGLNVEIYPSLPIDFIDIQPSFFWMGSNRHPYESPEHKINLTQAFSISKYEIAQWQWYSVMGYNNSEYKNDDFPVENISWLEAVKFCNQMSKLENLDTCYVFLDDTTVVWNNKFAKGYRLPTEAEWEYAAKADTSYNLAEIDSNALNLLAVYNVNSGYKPRRIGSLSPNKLGVYDILGNVWEYCWDYYTPNYYSIQPSTNPYGPAIGDRRVIRGGSFRDGAFFCSPSTRILPIDSKQSVGLRIVKNIN